MQTPGEKAQGYSRPSGQGVAVALACFVSKGFLVAGVCTFGELRNVLRKCCGAKLICYSAPGQEGEETGPSSGVRIIRDLLKEATNAYHRDIEHEDEERDEAGHANRSDGQCRRVS